MYTEAITADLLEILREIMQMDEFAEFALGGGTSLALRFGHRKSVDIDLFNNQSFKTELLLQSLKNQFQVVEIHGRTQGSLNLSIRGVKLDILHHAYEQVLPFELIEDIRFLSIDDLAAMKINALTNRGSKKDFSDLLLLHENNLPLGRAVALFSKKYGTGGRFLAIRSLQFFDDANREPDPVYLNGWTWQHVETRMKPLALSLSK